MTKDGRFIHIKGNLKRLVERFGNSLNEACLFISGAVANASFWSDRLCNNLVHEGFYAIKYDHRDFCYSSK